ncbi:MAG: TonB-dependent receptor, partial [Acidobacteriota bacterium]
MKRFSIFALLLISASLGYAQTGLATITGTITDQTGAALVGTPIVVRSRDTGSIFTAASSSTGNFTVSQLPIGDYDLTITSPGFKTYTHSQFHLAAQQSMREDAKLEVGQTSDSINVTAEASLLKTESSAVVQNVTLSQLNSLPILGVGTTGSGFRDPFNATRLVPGIRFAGGTNAAAGAPGVTTTMVVNGTPSNTYGTRLDGMTMNPTGPRLLGATMQTQPSVDALEEVAIQTSNFAAEYGASGGAMISMVTKSGTNKYHGSAYDYGTNEALNAHFPYTGLRSKIRQNDMGGTFGGPLIIPNVYNGTNKTFFFFSMELFKQANQVSSSSTVPVQAYRDGDFSNLITAENRFVTTATGNALDGLGNPIRSGTIFDPGSTVQIGNKFNRTAFVGNKIQPAQFDPVSAKVLSYVPLPQGVNFAAGLYTNNYTGTYDASRTSKIPSIKLDQNIGSKNRLSFYQQETNTRSPRSSAGANPLPDLITGGVTTFSSGSTVRINEDFTATPRLLLHFGIGWNDSDFVLGAPVPNFNQITSLGLKGATVQGFFPRITVGVSNAQIGGLGESTIAPSIGTYQPTASYERRPSIIASVTYVTGGHTFKLGFDGRKETFPNYVNSNVGGQYSFGTNYTLQPFLQGTTTNGGFHGFALASLELGGISSATLAAPTALANIKYQYGLYFQDTWKLTRKLTLDYGLRWDLGTYAKEQFGRNGSIGLAVPNTSASGRLGGTQFEATCKCQFAANYPYAIGPRLGLAYQIDRKTVLRAGIGVEYNSTSTASGSSTSGAQTGAVTAAAGQITGLFKNGMPAEVVAVWPVFNSGVGQPVGGVIGMPALLDRNAGRPARLLQWNVALQREITRNLVVEASYVANVGVWWSASALAPLNQLSQGRLQALGFTNFTSATEASLLTTTIANLSATQKSTLAARGIATGLPYANYPTTQTVRSSLLDYPQYSTNGLNAAPLGKNWYESFQLNATQRFSHGVSFNMNYNFSKTLENYSSPDVFNRSLGKNLGTFDLPHQLRLTLQYEVPNLRNAPYWKVKPGYAFDEAKHARNEAMKQHDHAPLRDAITA